MIVTYILAWIVGTFTFREFCSLDELLHLPRGLIPLFTITTMRSECNGLGPYSTAGRLSRTLFHLGDCTVTVNKVVLQFLDATQAHVFYHTAL